MYDYLPINRPLSKKELEDMEKDRAAERDLEVLIEAGKIRRTPERLDAALAKRAKMQEELERITAKPGATTESKK